MTRDNELLRRGDVEAAIRSGDDVRYTKCGGSRKNHHFRHPFSPNRQFDLLSAIDALPAVAPTPVRDKTEIGICVTDNEIESACIFYCDGYYTLSAEEQAEVRQQGLSWLHAWNSAYVVEWFRERNKLAAAATKPRGS